MPLGPAADTEGLKRLTVASNRWDGPPGPDNLRASTAGSGSQPQAQGAAMSRWAAAQQPTMCRTAPFFSPKNYLAQIVNSAEVEEPDLTNQVALSPLARNGMAALLEGMGGGGF